MSKNKSKIEKIADSLGVSQQAQDSFKKLIETGKDLFEVYSKVVVAVGATQKLLEIAGFLKPAKSEFDKLFDKICGELDKILDALGAFSKQMTMLAVSDIRGDVEGLFKAISNYSDAPQSKLNQAAIEQFNAPSITYVTDLYQAPKWWRLYPSDGTSSLQWGKHKYRPPVENDDFVWDYRLALPALLYSISARLLLLQVLPLVLDDNNATLNDQKTELQDCSTHLLAYYQRIRDGIVRIPAPFTLFYLGKEKQDNGQFYDVYSEAGRRVYYYQVSWTANCGVVDIYSGSTYREILPFSQPKIDLSPFAFKNFSEKLNLKDFIEKFFPQAAWNKDYEQLVSEKLREQKRYETWFYLAFAIRTERAWQELYKDIGLSELWGRIVYLKQLFGEYLPEIPPDSGWSVRKVIESSLDLMTCAVPMIEKPLLSIIEPDSLISVRGLASTLGEEFANVPVSLGDKPVYSSQISLRRMLEGD